MDGQTFSENNEKFVLCDFANDGDMHLRPRRRGNDRLNLSQRRRSIQKSVAFAYASH